MKHTRGPWKHAGDTRKYENGKTMTPWPDTVFSNLEADPDERRSIAQVYGIPQNVRLEDIADHPLYAESLANARLIAAAPELLHALTLLMESLPIKRDWLDPVIERMAFAAIRKAEGE